MGDTTTVRITRGGKFVLRRLRRDDATDAEAMHWILRHAQQCRNVGKLGAVGTVDPRPDAVSLGPDEVGDPREAGPHSPGDSDDSGALEYDIAGLSKGGGKPDSDDEGGLLDSLKQRLTTTRIHVRPEDAERVGRYKDSDSTVANALTHAVMHYAKCNRAEGHAPPAPDDPITVPGGSGGTFDRGGTNVVTRGGSGDPNVSVVQGRDEAATGGDDFSTINDGWDPADSVSFPDRDD